MKSYSRDQYVLAKKELDSVIAVIKGLSADGIVAALLTPTVSELQTSIINALAVSNSTESASQMAVDSQLPIFPIHIQNLRTDVGSYEQALFLSFHQTLLTYGFVCIVEVPSTVPGFAPALRGFLFLFLFDHFYDSFLCLFVCFFLAR